MDNREWRIDHLSSIIPGVALAETRNPKGKSRDAAIPTPAEAANTISRPLITQSA